jgi:DNA-binding transcriptional LysR family regulator
VKAAFQSANLEIPKARVVTLSMPLRAELVANGPYITAIAVSALQSSLAGKLKVLPIALPKQLGQVAILSLKNRTSVPIAQRFIETAREIAAGLGEQ